MFVELLVSNELAAVGPTERAGHCTRRRARISYEPEIKYVGFILTSQIL